MKGKAIIPLVLGLGIGIFAIKMFFNVLNKAKGGTGETVQVVRARVDIAPTIEITDQMVEMAAVPKALCPKLAARDKKEVIGRVTANSVPQGCPVVQSLLTPKGTLPGMAARIKDGYRAVAVKVDESVGVAGWVKPGSHVDIVAVMSGRSGSKNEVVSRVILQNVEILAVGQDLGNSQEAGAAVAKSVTLLVSPDDVPKLHLAATKGVLRLAMRNQYDTNPLAASATTTDNEILGISDTTEGDVRKGGFWSGFFSKLPKMTAKATDKPAKPATPKAPAVVAAPEPKWVIEVVNSGQSSELYFDGADRHARRMSPSTKQPEAKSAVATEPVSAPAEPPPAPEWSTASPAQPAEPPPQ